MSTALTGMVFNARRGRLKKTGQRTAYHVGDGGDYEEGLLEQFAVDTLGQYALTSDIEVAHLADNTLSFTAPNTIASAGNLLVGWAVNDLMVIKGTASNDGVVTVTGIGGAPANLTISAAVNEVAGAYMSLYKRAAHSNNCVRDLRTGKMWSRYTSNAELVGVLSNGTLNWYNVATVFPLHAGGPWMRMIAPDTLTIVGGAAEVTWYHVGDLIKCTGFANAANNLPGYYVVSVTVNGADLVIVLDPVNNVLVSEAGAAGRTIGLVTRSIFNYAAGANLIGLAGYTDWRNPDDVELASLRNMEQPTAVPNAAAFPGWPAAGLWSSTTIPSNILNAVMLGFSPGIGSNTAKTTANITALVRP